jgi:hypothetical protein
MVSAKRRRWLAHRSSTLNQSSVLRVRFSAGRPSIPRSAWLPEAVGVSLGRAASPAFRRPTRATRRTPCHPPCRWRASPAGVVEMGQRRFSPRTTRLRSPRAEQRTLQGRGPLVRSALTSASPPRPSVASPLIPAPLGAPPASALVRLRMVSGILTRSSSGLTLGRPSLGRSRLRAARDRVCQVTDWRPRRATGNHYDAAARICAGGTRHGHHPRKGHQTPTQPGRRHSADNGPGTPADSRGHPAWAGFSDRVAPGDNALPRAIGALPVRIGSVLPRTAPFWVTVAQAEGGGCQ